MFYVMFKDDNNRWFVKNQSFLTVAEAQAYADTIAVSRSPRIVFDVTREV